MNNIIISAISDKYTALFESKAKVLGEIAKPAMRVVKPLIKDIGEVLGKESDELAKATKPVIKDAGKAIGKEAEAIEKTGAKAGWKSKLKAGIGGGTLSTIAGKLIGGIGDSEEEDGANTGDDGKFLGTVHERNWPEDFPGEDVFSVSQKAILDGAAYFLIPEDTTTGLYTMLLNAISAEDDVNVDIESKEETDDEVEDDTVPLDLQMVKERFDEVSDYWELVMEYGFEVALDKRAEMQSEAKDETTENADEEVVDDEEPVDEEPADEESTK